MQSFSRIGIVGAGLMGSGIAQVAAQAGYQVVLRDTSTDALENALAAITKSQARFVTKNIISSDDAEAALSRISTTTELAAFAVTQLVVEAGEVHRGERAHRVAEPKLTGNIDVGRRSNA